MNHGGKRRGAGRPASFGEKTKPIRLPVSILRSVQRFVEHKGYQLPLYGSKVPAGFPSPADDHLEDKLDLNEHLIKHPAATFFVRVTGNSMLKVGIHDNDILIVDRSLQAAHGKIVVAVVDGQITVKRLSIQNEVLTLMPENDAYSPLVITAENDVYIWGVVTNVIHSL